MPLSPVKHPQSMNARHRMSTNSTEQQAARNRETPPTSPQYARSTLESGGSTLDDSDSGIELKPLVKSLNPFVVAAGSGSANDDDSESDLNRHGDFTTGTHAGATAAVGTASNAQVAVNIFISFVGAGLLGQPYAFSQSGWLMGAISVALVSAANVYAMLLLVKTRQKLEQKQREAGTEGKPGSAIQGYGDIGRLVNGVAGERFVNFCLVFSQVGFATAYIIFITANLHAIFPNIDRAWICFGCIPILSVLVQTNDMAKLSPFSLIADVANLLGLGAVLFQDYTYYEYHHEPIHAATNFQGVLYVASVAIYSLEGVNLVLPLESSCADRKGFPSLLKKVIFGITSLMISFGAAGYVAFGPDTEAPITLNLPNGSWSNFVKLALCLALYLTYPIMMFPVSQVLEDTFASFRSHSAPTRAAVVILTTLVAYGVPSFGTFLGLVGSSICMILGFILPCYFHLKVFERSELQWWEFGMDWFVMIAGTFMGVLGTYFSLTGLLD